MADELTPRQREILRFIAWYRKQRGYSPTIREIGRCADISSTNAVNDHLKALQHKRCITRDELVARSIVLTKRGEREIA